MKLAILISTVGTNLFVPLGMSKANLVAVFALSGDVRINSYPQISSVWSK
jgi:hypothetical protein